jgi:predicted Zn-dependent protease with MMP-like domain
MRINSTGFNSLVARITGDIISSLPDDLRSEAKKVEIITADKPSREQAGDEKDYDLLGLFEGRPLKDKHIDDSWSPPDIITIFRLPLAESCRNIRELEKEIRVTVIHELAHYFGFEEDELIKRGLG